MKRIIGTRSLAALVLSTTALVVLTSGAANAVAAPNAVTKTFSFVGTANGKTQTLVNINGLLINARCNAQGNPVIFGFSSSSNADLFGRFFDGLGRLHIVKNSSFTKKGDPKGMSLATSGGDFDASGNVLFETYSGKVVTVDYAFDDSTTLAKRNVCTVYGSYVAS
jgi:hypothetical protein